MALRVLIAEDEPSIVASLEFLLRKEGYDTRVAHDGEEALALAESFRPDLVLLDLMLPRRSGLEVCRWLRAQPGLRHARVLMLTAKGGKQDVLNGFDAGADDYLTKPFSTQDLMGRVRRLAATPPPEAS